jgi:hypothetical protein
MNGDDEKEVVHGKKDIIANSYTNFISQTRKFGNYIGYIR